jgi:hypothetical protein
MAITNFKRIDSDEVGHSVPFQYIDVVNNSETNYVAQATDAGDLTKFTSSSNVTVRIPTNSTTYIPVGTVLTFIQMGTGTVMVAPADGVTIRQEPGTTVTYSSGSQSYIRTRAQYSKIQFTKIDTDEWLSDGYGFYIQQTQPANPQVGDLWIW